MSEVPVIAHAIAARASHKGEDASAAHNPGMAGPPAAFAVFDGHSGKQTAQICSEKVCERLLRQGAPFLPRAVADVMWALDEEIGTQQIKDGATSQMMLVERAGEDRLRALFAWTGDSSAVVSNMATGKPVYCTESHTAGPDHQGGGAHALEKQRLELYCAVRKAIESKGVDTHRDEVGADEVREAIEATGKLPTDELVALLVRAFRRGRIIAETIPEGAASRKAVFVRQRSAVDRVWVVATAETQDDPGYRDLQMTRSIGDWYASDLVLPEPQTHSIEVPAGAVFRVCLASDGLWDVCSFALAADIMWRAPSVEAAAERLLRVAIDEYIGRRAHATMDDDTTVLVVELNPTGVKHVPPDLMSGCCALS